MDVHYQVSTILLLAGYILYTLGISSNTWKHESGYEYGLWYRCDRRDCVFYQVDYLGPINLVRIGVLLSSLLLTVSAICLLIEVALVISHSRSKHKQRLGKTVVITTVLAELISSVCLGCYGYKTLTKNHKLPSLAWGFAATGGGVIALFLGTIVKVMGPPSTWSDIPCFKNKTKRQNATKRQQQRNKRQICKQGDKSKRNKQNKTKSKSKSRPSKLLISHPSDIITYRKASEPLEGSCENLLVMSPHDSTCSSPTRYEEISLDRDFLYGRRTSQSQVYMTSSNQPSPRLVRDPSPAQKSSSLPPGISPGFYAHVHRSPRQRVENPYEITNGFRPNHAQRLQQSTLPSPRLQFQSASSPFRPIRVLTIDRASSVRSVPIPTPPPSPPLPPPPPPLSSATTTTERVNIRRMNSVGNHNCHTNSVAVDYAPSPTSLHSFGSYGY